MKKTIYPLLLLILCIINSCNRIDDPEQYGQGITLIFDNQETIKAQSYISICQDSVLSLYAFYNAPFQMPYLYMQIPMKMQDNIINEHNYNIMINQDANLFIEYYDNTEVNDGVENHGDWWAQGGYVKITEIDSVNQTFKGLISATMFNAHDRYTLMQPQYRQTVMNIIFNDIPLNSGDFNKYLYVYNR